MDYKILIEEVITQQEVDSLKFIERKIKGGQNSSLAPRSEGIDLSGEHPYLVIVIKDENGRDWYNVRWYAKSDDIGDVYFYPEHVRLRGAPNRRLETFIDSFFNAGPVTKRPDLLEVLGPDFGEELQNASQLKFVAKEVMRESVGDVSFDYASAVFNILQRSEQFDYIRPKRLTVQSESGWEEAHGLEIKWKNKLIKLAFDESVRPVTSRLFADSRFLKEHPEWIQLWMNIPFDSIQDVRATAHQLLRIAGGAS